MTVLTIMESDLINELMDIKAMKVKPIHAEKKNVIGHPPK